MRWWVVCAVTGAGLGSAGCPKSTPVEPMVEPPAPVEAVATVLAPDGPPAIIEAGVGLDAHQLQRVTLIGTLERRAPGDDVPEGTAVVLSDGVAVWVSEGEPPEAWGWMVGSLVRIQGTLANQTPAGHPHAWLTDPEAPMPGEATMPMPMQAMPF